jgi:hypothetical protein
MTLYHGTSREFEEFESGPREPGQLGRGFYFTDNEQVAENFAVFRHAPPMQVFDSDAALAQFLEENPGFTVTHRDELSGKVLASFTTPEFVPKVLAVELHLERALALDEPAPEDLLAAAGRAGVGAGVWATAADLWDAALEHLHGSPIGPEDDVDRAHAALVEVVRVAGYDAVTRPDERNGVAHRTWLVFDSRKIEITGRREIG